MEPTHRVYLVKTEVREEEGAVSHSSHPVLFVESVDKDVDRNGVRGSGVYVRGDPGRTDVIW